MLFLSLLLPWTVRELLRSAQKLLGTDTVQRVHDCQGAEKMPKGKGLLCGTATSAVLVWIGGFS